MTGPSTDEIKEAVARFGVKTADLMTALPAIAAPALGTYLGRRYGGDAGQLMGAIGGGVAGKVLSDQLYQRQQSQRSPYALDPTDVDIPSWALQGARMFGPVAKQAGHGGLRDVVLSDMLGPVYPAAEGYHSGGVGGALKHVAGSSAGIAAGGLLGHGAGALLNHFAGNGQEVKIPGLNIPVSTILSGLGATIGGVKGLDWARGQ